MRERRRAAGRGSEEEGAVVGRGFPLHPRRVLRHKTGPRGGKYSVSGSITSAHARGVLTVLLLQRTGCLLVYLYVAHFPSQSLPNGALAAWPYFCLFVCCLRAKGRPFCFIGYPSNQRRARPVLRVSLEPTAGRSVVFSLAWLPFESSCGRETS